MNSYTEAIPDKNVLTELLVAVMPYGKYKGNKIVSLPVHYLEWIARNGFPPGKLGLMLSTIHIIKTNGLENLLNFRTDAAK